MTLEERIKQKLGTLLFTLAALETENEKLRLESEQLKAEKGSRAKRKKEDSGKT